MASAAKAVVKICDMPNDMLESTHIIPAPQHSRLSRWRDLREASYAIIGFFSLHSHARGLFPCVQLP